MTGDDSTGPRDDRGDPTDDHEDEQDGRDESPDRDDPISSVDSTDPDPDSKDRPGDSTDDPDAPPDGSEPADEDESIDDPRGPVRDPDESADGRDEPRLVDDEGSDWLSSLLSALEALEEGALSGRRRRGRTTIDYDVSIGSAEDVLADSRFEGNPFGDDGAAGRGPDDERERRSRSRRYRADAGSSGDHRTATRRHEAELLVSADVAGVDPDEVTVGFDGSALVVAVSGRELERVDVPWASRQAQATINNGVLTVRVERDPQEMDEADRDTSTTENDDE